MKKSIVMISALTGLLLVGCSAEEEVQEERLRPVRYITVADPVAFRSRTFSGSSRSSQETRLSFKVSGTVAEIPVQVGDQLTAGDLVARIDPSQFEVQLQQRQASLVQAQASARNAQSNYERIKGLYENSNASRNDLDSARASAESSKAQQRASQKASELAYLELSYTELRVDNSCSVAEISVEVNENINVGAQVARVNCGEGLEVAIDVPESLIAGIEQNMKVSLAFQSIPDHIYIGTVQEIGVSSSGNSATFPVSVQLDQPDGSLRAGLAAEATIEFVSDVARNAFVIPLAAVVNGVDGPSVYVAELESEPGSEPADKSAGSPSFGVSAVVTHRSITLGELTEQGMEVLDGLARGDRVITAGVSVIREGQRVLLP